MASMPANSLCETTRLEQGTAIDTNVALIATLTNQNKVALRRQNALLVTTCMACMGMVAIVYGGHEETAHAEPLVKTLAADWKAYDLAWEECANSPDCDAWNTTEARLLIDRTRAAIPDPTLINGVVPPGSPGLSTGSPGAPWSEEPTHKMLEYVGRQPVENGTSTMYAVWYNSRRVMERTPIHVHPETQFTCILNGTLMFIAEGMETKNYTTGQCYVMPGMTKMVSVNVGDSSYVDLDIFRVSAGSVPWIVIEPSAIWMQSTQFGSKDEKNKPMSAMPPMPMLGQPAFVSV